MLGDDWFVRWCQFVCVVCVVLFLIELGINKFCGLGGERFLWCDMRVMMYRLRLDIGAKL